MPITCAYVEPQYNRCLQVVFAYESILIVRARTVELFPKPELRPADGDYATYSPIGFHTFGWIDGVSLSTQSDLQVDIDGRVRSSGHKPISLLLRAESDDPWASDMHKLEQFLLFPNPASSTTEPEAARPPSDVMPDLGDGSASQASLSPYVFPPVRAEQTSPTVRGFLRCRDIVLGPCGTALWIQPRAARTAHLTGFDLHSSPAQVSDGLNPDFNSHSHSHHLSFPGGGLVVGDAHGEYGGGGQGDGRTAECLCAGVFAGPLQRRCWENGARSSSHHEEGDADGDERAEMRTDVRTARTLWAQRKEGCNWTSLDYEEEVGRVALGSSDGSVTVLDLV